MKVGSSSCARSSYTGPREWFRVLTFKYSSNSQLGLLLFTFILRPQANIHIYFYINNIAICMCTLYVTSSRLRRSGLRREVLFFFFKFLPFGRWRAAFCLPLESTIMQDFGAFTACARLKWLQVHFNESPSD